MKMTFTFKVVICIDALLNNTHEALPNCKQLGVDYYFIGFHITSIITSITLSMFWMNKH